jgi:hypothetical protein
MRSFLVAFHWRSSSSIASTHSADVVYVAKTSVGDDETGLPRVSKLSSLCHSTHAHPDGPLADHSWPSHH